MIGAAHHNRFEPIRTALGQQVAEATFGGAQNIIVEGASDQILIAGLNTELRNQGLGGSPLPRADVLDLNEVVLVHAGGAPHVPYMTYLTRGRGEVKPPVVVLLDSDQAGDEAVNELCHLAGTGKPIIDAELVLRLSDAAQSADCTTIEDLVPWAAARAAVQHLLHALDTDIALPDTPPSPGTTPLAQLNAFIAATGSPIRCGKIAFAKSVVACLPQLNDEDRLALCQGFAPVILELSRASTRAAEIERRGQIRQRLARSMRSYRSEQNRSSQRHTAAVLLDELESLIDAARATNPSASRYATCVMSSTSPTTSANHSQSTTASSSDSSRSSTC